MNITQALDIVLLLAQSGASTDEDLQAVKMVYDLTENENDTMTNEEAGIFMKYIGLVMEEYSATNKMDADVALNTLGMLQLINTMKDSESHHGSFVIRGAMFGGVDTGDWKVTIGKIDEDGNYVKHDEEVSTHRSVIDPLSPSKNPTVDGHGNA